MSQLNVSQISVDGITFSDGSTLASVDESWNTVSTTATLESNEKYLADSSGAIFTVTLPASPSVGDYVIIADLTGNFNTNNVTVGRNSNNIRGAGEDLVLDVDYAVVTLTWSGNATTGWVIN